MKATTLLAMLPLLLAAPNALAQAEEAVCPNCIAQQQKIQELETKLLALQAPAPEAPVAAIPLAVETSGDTYTVEAGDSFLRIARKHGCKAGDLAAANGMTLESVIHPGQKLKLPTAASTAATPAAPKTYTIQEGDTYYGLSRRFKISLDKLMAANPKAKATELYNGRVINLPASTSSTHTATAATTSDVPAPPIEEPIAPPAPSKKIRSVMIEGEITYEEFAAQHGTDTERLNDLNGLDIAGTTVLAKGSELYVPAQP